MPHTKQRLQYLLEAAGITPRHRLGQNFLIDLNLMRLLTDSADLKGNETVLEVGCGTGSMTELLAQAAGAVVAVEIDDTLLEIATAELAHFDNITFLGGDVLTNKNTINSVVLEAVLQAKENLDGPFYLIANLPYQVASPLIINLLLGDVVPDAFYVTIQAEVAGRMLADSGKKKTYGLLSVLMQATGDLRHLRILKPQAFWPSPKVNSSMIQWRKSEDKYRKIRDIRTLKRVIDLLLGHRRKKIRNCLSAELDLRLLEKADIDPDARGESLEPAQFVHLANLCSCT